MNFVVDTGSDIIPVEVKEEVNLQAKSLKVYREKFDPKVSVRTSMADYKLKDWLINLPLWAIETFSSKTNDPFIIWTIKRKLKDITYKH